jgi:hypothetical protein
MMGVVTDKWYTSRSGWLRRFKESYGQTRAIVNRYSGDEAAEHLDLFKDIKDDHSTSEAYCELWGILQQAWEDAPDRPDIHENPGWLTFCDLCSEGPILWEDLPEQGEDEEPEPLNVGAPRVGHYVGAAEFAGLHGRYDLWIDKHDGGKIELAMRYGGGDSEVFSTPPTHVAEALRTLREGPECISCKVSDGEDGCLSCQRWEHVCEYNLAVVRCAKNGLKLGHLQPADVEDGSTSVSTVARLKLFDVNAPIARMFPRGDERWKSGS